MDDIYYKNYQSSRSITCESAFYAFDIVSRRKIALEIPGTGITFVLNPDYSDGNISSFPVTVFWEWDILRFAREFSVLGFSFSIEEMLRFGLSIFNVSDEQLLLMAGSSLVLLQYGAKAPAIPVALVGLHPQYNSKIGK